MSRVWDQMLGREQSIGFQAMTGLVCSVLAAAAGSAFALLRGKPWLDGALITGLPVLAVVVLTMLLPRIVGLLLDRRRSRNR